MRLPILEALLLLLFSPILPSILKYSHKYSYSKKQGKELVIAINRQCEKSDERDFTTPVYRYKCNFQFSVLHKTNRKVYKYHFDV